MESLPFEIIEYITRHLSILDLVRLRQCCRKINVFVNYTDNPYNKIKLLSIQSREDYIKSLDTNVIHNNLDVIEIGINHKRFISDTVWAKVVMSALALHRNKIAHVIISRSWLGKSGEKRICNKNNTIQLPISFYNMFLMYAIEVCNMSVVGTLISASSYDKIPQCLSEIRKLRSQIALTSPKAASVWLIDKIITFTDGEIMKGGNIHHWKTQIKIKHFITNL